MTNKEVKKLATQLKIDLNKIPLKELKKGIAVEREHKDITKGDPVMTAKIAAAHLKERADYYSILKKVEHGKKMPIKKSKRR